MKIKLSRCTKLATEKRSIDDAGIVKGWESLSRALHFYVDAAKKESNKKQFFRLSKKYRFPGYRHGNRVYMLKEDIETINRFYLFGIKHIADYLGIHVKTLHKWLKRYPKMPVDRERKIAFTSALDLWYTTLIIDRKKRGKATEYLARWGAPIMDGIGRTFGVMDRTGLYSPKQLRRSWLHPKNDI